MAIVSIIVPVYNAEKYLRQCLDSILKQSFKDFEVLLIDDGSTDQSGNICDEYAEKDKRISVWHQENQGVSVARNVGLEHAHGEWVYFPDSDDIVMTDALNMMVSLIDASIEYMMCGYEVYDEKGQCTYTISARQQKIIDRNDALMEMFAPADYRYNGYLWNKLFKASIIKENNLSFARGIKFNEDRLFNVEYISHLKGDVVYATIPIYQYIVRSTSAMASLNQRFNPSFITDLDAFIRMGQILRNNKSDNQLLQAHAYAMCVSVRRYYIMCRSFHELSLNKIKTIERYLMVGVGQRLYMYLLFYRLCTRPYIRVHNKIKRVFKT